MITVGSNRPHRWLVLAVALSAILVAGCGGGGSSEGGADGAAVAHAQGTPPPVPPVPVAVTEVSSGDIASYYTATATLAAEREAQILARVSGVAEALLCEEGDFVKEGQTMLRIDAEEYRLRLVSAEAKTADLESRHKRMEEMVAQHLVSDEEFDAVARDLKSARAEEELARLNLSYTTITAPFAGRVVQRMTDVGHNINPGDALFLLSDFNPLLARVHVPAKEFRALKPDQPVELVLESSGTHLTGRVKLVSPVINANSGTIKVTIEISDYPEGTRPGDFAQVRIVTKQRENSLLIPKIAVVTDKGEQVVFVSDGEKAERRVVEVGFEDDTNAEILSGLSTGESVVVKGQRSLKHGSPIKVLTEDFVERTPPTEGS